MTFSVVAVENEREKVVGTIWADGEAQAKMIASNVYPSTGENDVWVRPTELREIPFRLPVD